jgi:hypothetical protein
MKDDAPNAAGGWIWGRFVWGKSGREGGEGKKKQKKGKGRFMISL